MRMGAPVVSAVILSLTVLAAGCSKPDAPPQAPPPPAPASSPVSEGKALFEKKCSACHELTRATSLHETRAGWESIVKEMQGKKAGWISDEDAAKIVEFLVAEHGKK